jgi:hypothetical protein
MGKKTLKYRPERRPAALENRVSIKEDLYKRIRSQVADRLGLQDREIKMAEKGFSRFFSQAWRKSSNKELQKQIELSNLIFWGDFHGVRQYQKNLLRWLKKQDLNKAPLVLALECLPSKNQKWVDLFLTGELSESQFLEKVKWNQTWGFPWLHYKPLFDWARENKQSLKVINGPLIQGKVHSSNKTREKWGLSIVLKEMEQNPKAKVFVLYGEYHLLPQGFSRHLKSFAPDQHQLRTLFVFQNSDSLYFKKPPLQQTAEGEVFKKSSSFYVIQNVSPWVKWQNYKLFLDASTDSDMDDELDLTDHVLSLVQILSQTLQIPLSKNQYSIFASHDKALWDHLKGLSESELLFFEDLIEETLSFTYLPGDWAFLGRITANESASLAMQLVLFHFNTQLTWKKRDKENPWEFLIWIYAISYFGSKLINPHRKTPSLQELRKISRAPHGRPTNRQAARLTVNYTLHQTLGKQVSLGEIRASRQVRFQAMKWISGILGEGIYSAFNQGALNLLTLKTFLQKNPGDKNFFLVVQNLFEIVDQN